MPTSNDPRTVWNALPGPMRNFLMAPETAKQFRSLFEVLKLEPARLITLSDLVGEIDLGLTPLADLVPRLSSDVDLDEKTARKFAADLAGYRYLPIAQFMKTNVWQLIEKWGGDPTSYPAVKVEIRELTPKQLTEEVLKEAALTLTPQLSERAAHLMLSRIKGIRDDLELANILSRPEKLGGLGLAADAATRLVEILKYKLSTSQVSETLSPSPQPSPSRGEGVKGEGRVRVPSGPPPTPPKEKPTAEEALPAAKRFLPPSPTPPVEGGESYLSLDGRGEGEGVTEENEITDIKRELETKLHAEETSFEKRLAESIDSLIRNAKIRFSDPTLESRFKSITTARLRDLRDAAETTALLQLPTTQGGLGLSEMDAKRVAGIVEAEFVALQAQLGHEMKREALAYEEARKGSAAFKTSELQKKQTNELDQRYLQIAKTSKVIKKKGVILPPTPPPSPQPSPVKGEGVPVKFPSPLVGEGKGEGKKITPVLSPGSVAPQTSGKPRVEDVRFTRTLAGPIEELRTMTIVAFRRLSKDPKEITLKIRDKINLIQQEGHEKYVAAVRAWKESEPNRLYLELSRSALETGRPVPELIIERETQKQTTLTLAEFQVILSLNSGLRF